MAKIIIIINDNLLLYQKKKEMWKQIKIIVITLKMKWKITFYFLFGLHEKFRGGWALGCG